MLTDKQFRAIYDEHKNLVYNLALSYVQHSGDAQDIAQEVFVKVYQNLHKHEPDKASLKTWIYRITINQSLDFLKAKKTKKRFGFIVSLFQAEHNEPSVEAAHFDHPGIKLENKEQLQTLFTLINELPDNQKTVLILLKIEDRPQKEVAEIMHLSEKAVESLFQRAKQNLAKKLKD